MKKFNIISVKGNSIRIDTGIASFDVKVEEIDGRLRVQIPKNIFIPRKEDYDDLVGIVVGIYRENTSLVENTNHGYTERRKVNQAI